jgi:hypothetical protein
MQQTLDWMNFWLQAKAAQIKDGRAKRWEKIKADSEAVRAQEVYLNGLFAAQEDEMAKSLEDKRKAYKKAMDASSWYAACESGHPFWAGPDEDLYDDAQADATAHDEATHGGDPTAIVLGGSE